MRILFGCKQVLTWVNLHELAENEKFKHLFKIIGFCILLFNVLNAIIGIIVCIRSYHNGLTSLAIPAHFVLGNMSATAIFISLSSAKGKIRAITHGLQVIVDRRKWLDGWEEFIGREIGFLSKNISFRREDWFFVGKKWDFVETIDFTPEKIILRRKI